MARFERDQVYAWSVKADAEPEGGDEERSRDDQPAAVELSGRRSAENRGSSHGRGS